MHAYTFAMRFVVFIVADMYGYDSEKMVLNGRNSTMTIEEDET